jgi:hypothetical protein
LFGCQKSCGHPLIDPVRGGLSAAHEARTPDKTSLIDAQRLRNTFCHIILTSYVTKHATWPPLKYLSPGTILEILNSRQERNFSYHSYPLSDWDHTEWGKIFEMDYFPNFLELIDDKSISFYRSEKHLAWDEGNPRSQRRLLLEVLQRKNLDLKPLVEQVSKREIPDDWFIVSLYPKEREFKEDPRMFAMLVLEMRCFFTCIEANIAEHLFKYMPQQTMTKTKTQIQERFLTFTDPRRNPNDWTLFLEIDLSRWNLRWRQMVIHLVGHDLNNMFGVKGTFTVTHWFFSLCQIVVRVGGLRPEGIEKDYPPESGLAWRNHRGGFEGLNQKLWTAATYAMVEMALAPLLKAGTITSYELVGQGDNQVIRVSIPADGRCRETVIPLVRDEINDRLEKTCASVNQEVKPDENIESTSVLTYSKDVFVEGVEYPTSLKKHSRLFPVTSNDFPSTAMNASAIMAGAVAAAENSRHSLCSAIIGYYHTARYLFAASAGYSIHGRASPKMNDEEIIAALICPPSIGGYIGTPIASFLYKGGSDPLGKEISSLRLCAESLSRPGVIAGRALRALEEKYCIDPEPNLEVLIDNPYGLPIDKTASPLSQVSNMTLEAFRGQVKNMDIKPLLTSSISIAEQTLKDDILSITPLNPLLAHDLFDSSGFGTIKVMRKMFLATRTIQSVAQWVNPNITHNFIRADVNDIKWFKSWFAGLPKRQYSQRNSFLLVDQFRSYWGRKLHGVTNYQPLDCYHASHDTRHTSSVKWSSHSSLDLLTTRGPLSGYLGTSTREKRSEHGYKIVDAGAPSRSMMKLQLIRSQAYGNAAFNDLLDRIGLTRTNVVLSEITDLLQKVIGGSISHRYSTAIRNMNASYVGPLNFVTHIRLDTDHLGKLSGSVDNYPVMLQEHMVLTMAEAKLLHIHRGVKSGELIVDTDQMVPLPEDSLNSAAPKFTSASLPKSKLLYTPDLMIARTYESTIQSVPRGIVAHSSSYKEREVIELGAVGFFLALLRDNNKAKLLADTRGLAAIPSSLQMDIAEAHAIGPLALLKRAADAILLSSLRDTFRTLHLHPERWDESLFIVHNISTCVKACSSYWRHPLLRSHPDSLKLGHSRLIYASTFSLEQRLISIIRRNIWNVMRDVNHRFWTQPIPTFAGTGVMSPVEALTIAGAKLVYPFYLMQHPQAREFGNLYSSLTRLPVKTIMTPDDQLSLLRSRYAKLSTLYSKAGDQLLFEATRQLGHMRGVLVFNDDVRTVLRHARELKIGQGPPLSQNLKPKNIPDFGEIDCCFQCLPNPLTKEETIWRKNSARPNGGVASAGYTWAPLLHSLKILDHCMIVGSGNGGLADLLLSCFPTVVTGTDLEKDMPPESATLLNYLPIGVQRENAQRYIQSDLCLTTTGDWTDKSVRQQFLSSLLNPHTLIIDATGPSPIDVGAIIDDGMKFSSVERIYSRIIGNELEIQNTLKDLRCNYSIRFWCVSRTHHSLEVIAEISRDHPRHYHRCSELKPLYEYKSPIIDQLIPTRKPELAAAATCSVFNWETETLEEMNETVLGLCVSLLNKPKSRQMLYKDRMSLITAHLTLHVATASNPVGIIQDWISDEMCETEFLKFVPKQSTITHLLRYVPRLRSAFWTQQITK